MSIITNFNDFEKLLHHSFYNELRITPEESPLVFIEPPFNPKNNREKTVSILFETFNVPALLLAHEAMCTMVAVGKENGLVLDSGFSRTIATCVLNYHPLTYTSVKTNLGGGDADSIFVKLLEQRGIDMTRSAEREIVRDMKEKLCYVALDTEIENEDETVEYELPDSSKLKIGSERYEVPELTLFNPSMIGYDCQSVQETVTSCIEKCPKELQRNMFHEIVLSGGNLMFKGTDIRLHFELEVLNDREDIKVSNPMKRNLNWQGASIIGSMSSSVFNDLWISKEDYDDAGATIAHRIHF